jgi:hypothetical protein
MIKPVRHCRQCLILAQTEMPLAEPSDISLLCTFINLNVSERETTGLVSHPKTIERSFVTGTWHEPVTGLPFKSQRKKLRLYGTEDVETGVRVRMFSNALFLTLFTAWSEMDQGVPL